MNPSRAVILSLDSLVFLLSLHVYKMDLGANPELELCVASIQRYFEDGPVMMMVSSIVFHPLIWVTYSECFLICWSFIFIPVTGTAVHTVYEGIHYQLQIQEQALDDCPAYHSNVTWVLISAQCYQIIRMNVSICRRLKPDCIRANHNHDGREETLDSEYHSFSELELVSRVEKKQYEMGTDEDHSQECCICLNTFENGEEITSLKICEHRFHPKCIEVWLRSKPECPLCRRHI